MAEFNASEFLNNAIKKNEGNFDASAFLDSAIKKNDQNFNASTYIDKAIRNVQTEEERKAVDIGTQISDAALRLDASQKRAAETLETVGYVVDRNIGEVVQDTAAALGVGVVQVADTAVGLANIASFGAVDDAFQAADELVTGEEVGQKYSQRSGQLKEAIKETFYSDSLQEQESRRALQSERDTIANAEEFADNNVKEFANNFWDSLEGYIDRPGLALNTAIESLPQMFVPGKLAQIGVKSLGKGLTAANMRTLAGKGVKDKFVKLNAPRMTAKYLASKEGKKAISKIQERTGLSYIAASEGISNGMEVQAEILNASHDELLASSDVYAKMIADGVNPVDAQDQLADKAGLITTGVAGLFGAVASKATGAGKFEGAMFRMQSPLGEKITKKVAGNAIAKIGAATVGGGLREGAEETLQGGGGTLAGNLAKKITSNTDQDLGEGVAQAAGQGLAIGTLSGGGLAGVASVADETGKGARKVAVGAAKGVLKAGELAKKASPAGKAIKEAIAETSGIVKEGFKDVDLTKAAGVVANVVNATKSTAANIKKEARVQEAARTQDPEMVKEFTDASHEDYDPRAAVTVMLSEAGKPKEDASPEEITTYLKDVGTHVSAQIDVMMDELMNVAAVAQQAAESGTEAEQATATEALKVVGEKVKVAYANKEKFEALAEQKDPFTSKTLEAAINEDKSPDEVIRTFFGSAKNVKRGATVNQAKTILKKYGDELTTPEKEFITEYVAMREELVKDNDKGAYLDGQESINKVRSEVVLGSKTNLGYVDFLDDVTSSVQNDDQAGAKHSKGRLDKFVAREEAKLNAVRQFSRDIEPHIEFTSGTGTTKPSFQVINQEGITAAEIKVQEVLPAFHFTTPNGASKYAGAVGADLRTGKKLQAYADKVISLSSDITPRVSPVDDAGSRNESPTQGTSEASDEGIGRTKDSATSASTEEKTVLKASYDNIKSKDLYSALAPAVRVGLLKAEKDGTVDTFLENLPTKAKENILAQSGESIRASARDGNVTDGVKTPVETEIKAAAENINSTTSDTEKQSPSTAAEVEGDVEVDGASTAVVKEFDEAYTTIQEYNLDKDVLKGLPEKFEDITPEQKTEYVKKLSKVQKDFDAKTTKEERLALTSNPTEQFKLSGGNAKGKARIFRKAIAKIAKIDRSTLTPRLLQIIENNSEFDLDDVATAGFVDENFDTVVNTLRKLERERDYDIGKNQTTGRVAMKVRDEKGRVIKDEKGKTTEIKNYVGTVLKTVHRKFDNNVLRKTPDFVNKYINKAEVVMKKVSGYTAEQQKGIQHFVDFAKQVDEALLTGIEKDGLTPLLKDIDLEDFKTSSLVKVFFNDVVDTPTDNANEDLIDPNMRAIVAVSLYNWMTADAVSSLYNDDETINKILGRDTKHYVTPAEREVWQKNGTLRGLVESSAGQDMMDVMGLKARGDAHRDTQQRFSLALGQLVVATGLQLDLMEERVVEMDAVEKLNLDNPDSYMSEEDILRAQSFEGEGQKKYSSRIRAKFKVVQNAETGTEYDEITDDIAEHIKVNKENSEVFHDLFGTKKVREPSFNKPTVKDLVKLIKRSASRIPRKSRRIIHKHNQIKHKTTSIMSTFEDLGEGYQFDAMGGERDIENAQVNLQRKYEAVNNSIMKTIRDVNYFMEKLRATKDGTKTPFYFMHEMWKNGRIGMIGNVLNIQGNKHARFLLGMSSHEVTFSLVDNTGDYQNFMLAAAEAMDLNMHQSDEKVIADLRELMADPVVAKALDVLANHTEGTQIKDGAAVVAAVKKGKLGLHSLHGLKALSDLQVAEKNGERTMTTDLTREVDGINNGLVLTSIQMEMSNPDQIHTLNRGGIYTDKTYETVTDFKDNSPNGKDVYQDFAMYWQSAIKKLRNDFGNDLEQFDATVDLVGSFTKIEEGLEVVTGEGRTYAKNPVMTFVYGANPKTIIEKFIKGMYDTLYTDIGDLIVNENDSTEVKADKEAKRIALEAQLNLVIDPDKVTKDGVRYLQVDLSNPKTFKFSRAQARSLEKVLYAIHGSALNTALETKFEKVLERKEHYKDAYNDMFKMFNAVFEETVFNKEAELKRALSMDEIEAVMTELRPMLPSLVLPTAASDETDSVMEIMSELRQRINPDEVNEYYDTVKLTTGKKKAGDSAIKNTGKEGLSSPRYSLSTRITREIISQAGHRAAVNAIHAIDSAIIQELMAQAEIVNVFDAHISDITNVSRNTVIINQAIDTVMRSYDFQGETAKQLTKSMKLYAENGSPSKGVIFEPRWDPIAQKKVSQFTKMQKNRTFLEREAVKDTKKRIELLDKIQKDGRILQYNDGTNGESAVTFTKDELTEQEEILFSQELTELMIEEAKELAEDEQTIQEEGRLIPTRHTLGSSANELDIENFNPDLEYTIAGDMNKQGESVEGVFDLLGDPQLGNTRDDVEHQDYLRKFVSELGLRVVDPLKVLIRETLADETIGAAALNPNEVYVSSAAGPKANGITMSNQETFAHELSHVVISEALNQDNEASRYAQHLYDHAKTHVTPEMLLNDPADVTNQVEMDAAQARYDYIFRDSNVRNEDTKDEFTGHLTEHTRSNYLHEFIAFGRTNKNLMKALEQIPRPAAFKEESTSFMDAIFKFFKHLVSVFDRKYLKIDNQSTGEQLHAVALRLADIDRANKVKVEKGFNPLDILDSAIVSGVKNFVLEPLTKLAASKYVTNHNVKIIRKSGELVTNLKDQSFQDFIKAAKIMRRRSGHTSRNFIESLISELVGVTNDNRYWHQMIVYSSRMIDQTHKATSTRVTKEVISNFIDGEKMDSKTKTAITKVLLRTDFSVLFDQYDAKTLEQIVTDGKFLQAEIQKLEDELNTFSVDTRHFYRKMSHSLANIMVNGRATEYNTMLNAHTISMMYGNDHDLTARETERTDDAEKIIDKLTTLIAIQKTAPSYKKAVAKVMNTERKRTDGKLGGINFMLQMMRENKEQSKKKLFKDSENLMAKGYVKELYDPNVSFKLGRASEEAEMLKAGYVLVSATGQPMGQDPDLQQPDGMMMYVNTNAEVTAYQPAASPINQEAASGSDLIKVAAQYATNEFTNPAWVADQDNVRIFNKRMSRSKAIRSAKPSHVTDTDANNLLVPVINADGDISAFRYIMKETVKDSVLNRDNDFDTILGKMEANISDKVNARHVNDMIVDALKLEYDQGYATSEEGDFTRIALDSTDPFHKEIWQMMPGPMRQQIKKVWGADEIYIRDDIIPLVFGRRKFSLADQNNLMKRAGHPVMNHIGSMLEQVLGKPGVRKAESIWQEIISTTKDVIVVKTGIVLAGNIISNIAILLVAGVPAKDIVKHHITAIRESKNYMADIARRDELQRLVVATNKQQDEVGITQAKVANLKRQVKIYEQELGELGEKIHKNPVRELNEAGVYQTIVEDLGEENEKFSYKSKLADWAEPVTMHVPKPIKTVAKHVFMSHDTPAYKFMRDSTQLSDFVARYTLHEHNKANGMKVRESVEQIIRVFVNYDVATHKGIQYANDMGFVMFTKFAIRIQRVIYETTKAKPGRALTLFLLQHVFGDISDISDSIGYDTNRFNFVLPMVPLEAVGDIAPIAAFHEITGL